MNEQESEKEKHPTVSGATEPQEEFIEQEAQPSQDEKAAAPEDV